MSFAIFDENYYLVHNPDVQAAVDAGVFSSGLQHFQLTGLNEGRVLVSPHYDEQFYLRAHPDVAFAVTSGAFQSGLQHYIRFGEAEGRSAGAFYETAYLNLNPDVAALVGAGIYTSGLQHYIQVGQFEVTRQSLLLGTSGSDVITSYGEGLTAIIEVGFDTLLGGAGVVGVGEVDILIGGAGTDAFFLGLPSLPGFSPLPQQFYVGGGDADYALIQNFERFSDLIILAGLTQDYNFQAVNENFHISTAAGDLVGIVEGVSSLIPLEVSTEMIAQITGIPMFPGSIVGLI